MSIRALLWSALFAATISVAGPGCRDAETHGARRDSRPSPEAGARATFVETRQAQGARDSGYALQQSGDGKGLAANIGADLVAQIDEEGLSWAPRDHAWRATLSTRSYGCEGSLAPVAPLSSPRIAVTPNRSAVDERAGDLQLSEWYVNGPLGLEQGWTLDQNGCGATEARIEVAVSGLVPTDVGGGRGVDLRDDAGVARLRYSDLWARDADGRALASRMAVAADVIEIRVDTRGAKFPVVVDPLVWVSPQNLTAPDLATAGGSQFGGAVAVSGTNAVVGARFATGQLGNQGEVYAFHRTNGTWGTPQEIFAPDPVAGGAFGGALALSGTAMVVGAADSTVGINQNQGAVYVYTQANGVWGSPQKLTAADGGAFDTFGAPAAIGATPIAISGTTIMVGAFQSNAAYVFTSSGGVFTQQQKLAPSDAAVGMQFGSSVAISGASSWWAPTTRPSAPRGASARPTYSRSQAAPGRKPRSSCPRSRTSRAANPPQDPASPSREAPSSWARPAHAHRRPQECRASCTSTRSRDRRSAARSPWSTTPRLRSTRSAAPSRSPGEYTHRGTVQRRGGGNIARRLALFNPTAGRGPSSSRSRRLSANFSFPETPSASTERRSSPAPGTSRRQASSPPERSSSAPSPSPTARPARWALAAPPGVARAPSAATRRAHRRAPRARPVHAVRQPPTPRLSLPAEATFATGRAKSAPRRAPSTVTARAAFTAAGTTRATPSARRGSRATPPRRAASATAR